MNYIVKKTDSWSCVSLPKPVRFGMNERLRHVGESLSSCWFYSEGISTKSLQRNLLQLCSTYFKHEKIKSKNVIPDEFL